jgi:hypothetical protein
MLPACSLTTEAVTLAQALSQPHLYHGEMPLRYAAMQSVVMNARGSASRLLQATDRRFRCPT